MYAEPEIIKAIVSLLSRWGWTSGLKRIEADIKCTADLTERTAKQFFIGWIASERGRHQEARQYFEAVAHHPLYIGWARVGQAFVALREYDYALARQLLQEAKNHHPHNDRILQGSIAHCLGTIYYHEDQIDAALKALHAALQHVSTDPLATGRVFDTLGMIYDAKGYFEAARTFYRQSIQLKSQVSDEAGVALTHGNLGRLYLDWGLLNQAEQHFRIDYNLVSEMQDTRSTALMANWLGKVCLETQKWTQAADLLQQSIALASHLGARIPEGYARKDYALALLQLGKQDDAIRQVEWAESIFKASDFAEGMAHLNRVRGMIRRHQGTPAAYDEAIPTLRDSVRYFRQIENWGEAAASQFEVARTLRCQGLATSLVVPEILSALDLAEMSYRPRLIETIETELCTVDEVAYWRHVYCRARGRDVAESTASLLSGERDTLTIMFLDLKGSTAHGRDTDPQVVMTSFNQMMAHFAGVLKTYSAIISGYRGDGFMAMFRDRDHAQRGAEAGLDLCAALADFNLPWEMLGEEPYQIRIGISTGEVAIGNTGTYDKIDFTAIGSAANLAARLESLAEPGLPCISEATYKLVHKHFVFKDDSGRIIKAKGFEPEGVRVWDIVKRS